MKVNKYCKVNFNNPIPCKEYAEVVVNIEAIDKTDGFLNFVFLMDDEQKGYEWADHYTNLKETNKMYIKEIEAETNLSEDVYNKIILDEMGYNEYGSIDVDYIAVKIKTRNKEFYALATNYDNGYCYHDVYYTNDAYKISTNEDNNLITRCI